MSSRRVSFAGKRVDIGLEVPHSFFVASCLCEGAGVKRCRLGPSAEAVISLIAKDFPAGEVQTCYEAG